MSAVDIRAEGHVSIGGDVVARDKIVNNIGTLVQRALTAAEEAEQARAFEAQRLAQGVSAFAQRLQARAGEMTDADAGGPYKGLLEYRLNDAELFFGRDRAVGEFLQHLQRGPLTVLHAESGAGKTSLLQAGISPRLIGAGHLPLYLRPYNVEPSLALKRAFLADLAHTPGLAAARLRAFLRQVSEVLGQDTILWVLLDQFEEFFTQLDEPTREEFVGHLAECLGDESLNVRWILSIRSEFFGNLADFRPRIRNPYENDYRLSRLTRAEAQEVVSKPAARQGITFERGLIDALLDDLGADEVVPPQLQLVCLALYEALGPGETTVTRGLYDRLGGSAGILKGHLERVLERDLPRRYRDPAHLLLEALITSDARRVLRTRPELAAELMPYGVTHEALDVILGQLVDSRMLRVEEGDASGAGLAYELAHDYLVDQVELSPEARARKAAQELLDREVLNWDLFGALMRAKTLQVVGAQREVLQIDGVAGELLVRSAFETGVDLDDWLAFVPPHLARKTLLAGLQHADPDLRARAARHLTDYFDAEAESRLFQCALCDDEQRVRDAAFHTLAELTPDKARQVLLADMEHPEPARRIQAARASRPYLDAEVVEKLFSLVLTDDDVNVWEAALETLVVDEAAPYRANWHPLLKAGLWRRANAYDKLKRLRADLPRSFRWRVAPARLAHYLRREATTRPLWLFARLLLVMVLYFGLAWLRGWPPFLRWERVAGAPQEGLSAMEVVRDRIYVGSFDYGMARRDAEGDWFYWLRDGLPTGTPAKFTDPTSNVRTIEAIAADPANPDRLFVTVRDNGVRLSEDAGATWTPVGVGEVPANGLALDMVGGTILMAAGTEGLYGSDNDGHTWHKLSGENGLPDSEFSAVRFDSSGAPYVGGEDGLYHGMGTLPWVWEKVAGVPPVGHLDLGPDQQLYLALGWPRLTQAACYTPSAGLGVVTDFRDNVITALTAHPTEPDVFYVGTIDQLYELNCDGSRRELGQVPLVKGVSDLALLPDSSGDSVLIQANSAGLYQRPP